jgi:uncharacterized OsmC-like protein
VGVAHDKGIDLRGVEVDISHKQNIVVGGPLDPRQRQLRMTELRRSIRVRGELSDQERDAILWGANHCPVSNTLEGGVDLTTSLEIVDDAAR